MTLWRGLTLRAPEPREAVPFDAVLFPSATESTRGPVTLTFGGFTFVIEEYAHQTSGPSFYGFIFGLRSCKCAGCSSADRIRRP